MVYKVEDEKVKKIGRTVMLADVCWCGLSGSGIAFYATGTDVAVSIVGDDTTAGNETEGKARIGIYVDGRRVVDSLICKPKQKYEVFHSQTTQTVLVQVLKLSECAMSVMGIQSIEVEDFICKNPQIAPVENHNLKLEFIGDSITCGYGVDLEDPETMFETATEDVTRAYAYRTAQLLGADYSMCSYSGYGIISGYTEEDKPFINQLVPPLYEKVGFSYAHPYGTEHLEEIPWDFSKYQPDVVVLNLGTNDDSYCQDDVERQKTFSEEYAKFLSVIRKNNPKAHILCTIGTMCQRIADAVEMGVHIYQAVSQDAAVSYYKLPLQLPEDGLVSCYHPTAVSHEKAARLLTEEISRIIQ